MSYQRLQPQFRSPLAGEQARASAASLSRGGSPNAPPTLTLPRKGRGKWSKNFELSSLPHWPLLALTAALTVLALLYLSLAFLGLLDRPAAGTARPRAAHVSVNGINLLVPQDLIRFDHQRTGALDRLDLAVPWQEKGAGTTLIFISVTPKDEALPPPQRVSSVYKKFLNAEIQAGPSSLAMRRFTNGSGYDGEVLVYDPLNPGGYFVRCAPQAVGQPASCLREIRVRDKIDVVYRFPQTLLPDWSLLEQNVRALMGAIGVPEE
jgi:hypothetical protein